MDKKTNIKLAKLGIIQNTPLMGKELGDTKNLPDDVYYDSSYCGYFRIKETSADEVNLNLELKNIELLSSIKSMIKFFVVLTCISLTALLIYLFIILSNIL